MLICRGLALPLISLAYKKDQNLKKELPGNTRKRYIKRDFKNSSKIMWLSFVFKYRKAKGSFLEIAAPLKGGHSQTGTGRSPERQGPCQCQEHKSSFYAGEDALRINVMSCGALPWPQQAMGTAGLPLSSIPACSDPSLHSLQPHISGFAGTKAGQTGTFEPHPTTSLNHIPSKQKCPGKKGEEKWSACQKTLNL